MINPILSPKDYQDAINMANASNALAIVNWLAARIDQVLDAYPGDLVYAETVHELAKLMADTWPARSSEANEAIEWLWQRTYTVNRWMIASDPAVALAVQVIANITALPGCNYGFAPDNLYDVALTKAELFSWVIGAQTHHSHEDVYMLRLILRKGLPPTERYRMEKMLRAINNVTYTDVDRYDWANETYITGLSKEPLNSHLPHHLGKWQAVVGAEWQGFDYQETKAEWLGFNPEGGK